jgi:scyllo-inositol 2-dehydrogenase (NADP+)
LTGASGSADLRAAVIGYGLSGEAFHAPLISAVPGIEVAAIVTRDEARRRRAAQRYPDAALCEDVAEIWEDADRFDIAVVAAPNRAHVPLARAALEAGLAVVADKPLAASAGEGRDLVEFARRRGLALFPFQNRRWDGDLLTVRRLAEEGELGEVWRFESRFERWRPQVSAGWRERPDPGEAGGLLYDLGSHLVDQALHLFGPARDVYAELDARRPGAEVDDDAFVGLTHESGVRSHLWMSAVAAQPGPRFRVLGERAAYVKYGLDVQEQALREGRLPSEPGWGREEPDRWGLLGVDGETRAVETEPGAYQRFYEGVVSAIPGGTSPPVAPEEAVEALAVLDAAKASDREGRLVRLGQLG